MFKTIVGTTVAVAIAIVAVVGITAASDQNVQVCWSDTDRTATFETGANLEGTNCPKHN